MSSWKKAIGPGRRGSVLAWTPLILALLAPWPAVAQERGTRIDVEFLEAETGRSVERASVWVSGRKVRIAHGDPGRKEPRHVLIYQGDADRFYSLDHEKRVYIEIDRALIAAMGIELTAARREVDAQIQQLPRDQHAMLERLIGARETEDVLEHAPVRLVPNGDKARVAGRVCRKLDLMREKAVIGVVCTVPWKEIGLKRDDVEIFRQLANFQRELMGAQDLTPLEIVPNQDLDLLVQFDGFPMYLRLGEIGAQRSVIQVTALERFSSPTSLALFEPPSDYSPRSPLSLLLAEEADAPAPAPARRAP